jgi:Protein of unknown function (DUF3237)
MRLDPLCHMTLQYTGDYHLVRPYGNESGLGWGIGTGSVTGDRLTGELQWSNQPSRRGDGTMLPNARAVITTAEGAEVFCDLTGRTVFVEQGGETVGRQLLMTLFESEDERYSWLNKVVCMTEGVIDPEKGLSRFVVHVCESDLV